MYCIRYVNCSQFSSVMSLICELFKQLINKDLLYSIFDCSSFVNEFVTTSNRNYSVKIFQIIIFADRHQKQIRSTGCGCQFHPYIYGARGKQLTCAVQSCLMHGRTEPRFEAVKSAERPLRFVSAFFKRSENPPFVRFFASVFFTISAAFIIPLTVLLLAWSVVLSSSSGSITSEAISNAKNVLPFCRVASNPAALVAALLLPAAISSSASNMASYMVKDISQSFSTHSPTRGTQRLQSTNTFIATYCDRLNTF